MGTSFEAKRLAVLRALDLLDTPPEPEFDTIVAAAKQLFDAKSAFISLIEADRQWFKARCDLDVCETARDISFCTHAIERRAMLVVPDALADPVFAANPLVVGPPFVRFYAGVPLHARGSADGERLPVGTLCVIDDVPRNPDPEQLELLKGMALVIEALLELRRTSRESLALVLERHDMLVASERLRRQLSQAERMAKVGSWRLDVATEQVSWSDQTYAIHALAPGDGTDLSGALGFYPPVDRARLTQAVADCMEHGRGYDLELDLIDADGVLRRVRAIGEPELEKGKLVAIIGVVQDISERYRLEHSLRELAQTDDLTRLATRRAFNDLADAAIAESAVDGAPLAVLLIDLDRFKEVNDRMGHAVGDEVLRRAAATMREAAYLGSHVAARLGGDEFVILLRGRPAAAGLQPVIARLLGDLRQVVTEGGEAITVTATIGASRLAPDTASRFALLKAADTALYRAKQARRGTGATADTAEIIMPQTTDTGLASAA